MRGLARGQANKAGRQTNQGPRGRSQPEPEPEQEPRPEQTAGVGGAGETGPLLPFPPAPQLSPPLPSSPEEERATVGLNLDPEPSRPRPACVIISKW